MGIFPPTLWLDRSPSGAMRALVACFLRQASISVLKCLGRLIMSDNDVQEPSIT